MNKRDPLGLSNEAIDHQGESLLFKELTLAYKALFASKQSVADEREAGEKIVKIIGRHTGILIDRLMITDDLGQYMDVVKIGSHNPLLQAYEGLGYKEIDEEIGVSFKLKRALATTDSHIDYKKGKITGALAKVPYTLEIGRLNWRWARVSPEEMAAITIHEIGHAFTMMSNVTRTVTANMAVTTAVDAMMRTQDDGKRLRLIQEIQKDLGWVLDENELAKSRQATTYEAVFSRAVIEKQFPSATGASGYELSSGEFVADQFAVRHGGGVHLATGMDKLNAMFSENRRRTKAAHVTCETLKLVGWVIMGAATSGVVPLLVLPLIAIWGGYEDRLYDSPNDRIERMRRDLIQGLKDTKLPKNHRIQIQDNINALDKLLEGAKDRRTLANIVWQSLHPKRRAAYNARMFQQELEKVVNNDIFAAANSLSILAAK